MGLRPRAAVDGRLLREAARDGASRAFPGVRDDGTAIGDGRCGMSAYPCIFMHRKRKAPGASRPGPSYCQDWSKIVGDAKRRGHLSTRRPSACRFYQQGFNCRCERDRTRAGDRRRLEEQAAIPGNDRAFTKERIFAAPRPPSDPVQIDPSGSAEPVKLRAPASRRDFPWSAKGLLTEGQETKGGLRA